MDVQLISPTMHESEFYQAAQAYAAKGWPVFPVWSNAKNPLTKNGLKDATTDLDQIGSWAKKFPAANLGIRTGAEAGIVVIDLDVKNGENGVQALTEAFGDLPVTLTATTPSGGLHLYFEHPGSQTPNRTDVLPGVDFRGDEGYVLAAPSTIKGVAYEFTDDLDPAPLPPEFQTLLEKKQHKLGTGKAGTSSSPSMEGVAEGSRDVEIFRYAASLRARGLAREEATHLVLKKAKACTPPFPPDEALKKVDSAWKYNPDFTLTDVGNAQRLEDFCQGEVKWVSEQGRWFVWDHLVWRHDRNGEMVRRAQAVGDLIGAQAKNEQNEDRQRELRKHAHRSASRRSIDAMLELAKAQHGVTMPLSTFDADPMVLSVANGLLDLVSGQILDPVPSNYVTRSLDVGFVSTADCPRWRSFLLEIFGGDKDVVEYVQQAVGYTLTGSTKEQCLFFLYGTGSNGKTIFLNVLRALLAPYAAMTPIRSLMQHRNENQSNHIARLHGSRFVGASEGESGDKLSESTIKQLTGGDAVTVRFLFREYFEFRPQFKIWVLSNHRPTVTGTDHAIWRRIRLVPFRVKFGPETMDTGLESKLMDELPGILNWAVQGCLKWQESGLKEPSAVAEATAAYQEEMNPLSGWLKAQCEFDPAYKELLKDLYDRYEFWAAGIEETSISKKAFRQLLEEQGYTSKRHCKGMKVMGLRLKETSQEHHVLDI